MKIVPRKNASLPNQYSLIINNRSYELDEYENRFIAGINANEEVDILELIQFERDEIPTNLNFWLDKSYPYQVKYFDLNKIENYKNDVILNFDTYSIDLNQNKEFKWSVNSFCKTLIQKAENRENITIKYDEDETYIDDPHINIKVKICSSEKLDQIIKKGINHMEQLIIDTEKELSKTVIWKKEYENNEALFSHEVITPLLHKMKFNNVIYNHGNKEYGKDFTFNEVDRFGQEKNYAIQVKSGNISGGVNSQIDEIIYQIKDSFEMPFIDVNSKSQKYISCLIIIISGKFTFNAKEKILNKINHGLHGSLYFFDKEKIIELLHKY